MIGYNIYYNGKKINKLPVSKETVDKIKKHRIYIVDANKEYNAKDLQIYKCTIV